MVTDRNADERRRMPEVGDVCRQPAQSRAVAFDFFPIGLGPYEMNCRYLGRDGRGTRSLLGRAPLRHNTNPVCDLPHREPSRRNLVRGGVVVDGNEHRHHLAQRRLIHSVPAGVVVPAT